MCRNVYVCVYWHLHEIWCFDSQEKEKKNSNIFNRNRMKTIFSLFSVVWQACAMWHVSSHACIRWFWICMQSKSNEMILNITFYHCVCVCLCTTYYAKFPMLSAESGSFCCLCSFFPLHAAHLYGLIFEMTSFFELCMHFMDASSRKVCEPTCFA